MTGRNVLAPMRLLTKTFVKREVAAAIAKAQARNGWSNDDTGDLLGCCGNTIVNRKEGDDPGKQMTVYELLRAAVADAVLANEITSLAGFLMIPMPDAKAEPWGRDLKELGKDFGEVSSAICECLGDDDTPGRITAAEVRKHDLIAKLDRLAEITAEMRAQAVLALGEDGR